MLYPNRLINLKQTVKHLRLKHCFTRAAIAIVSTIIQCVFTWDAITVCSELVSICKKFPSCSFGLKVFLAAGSVYTYTQQ